MIVENRIQLSSSAAGPDYDPDGTAVALVDVVRIHPWTSDDLVAAAANEFEEGWLAWTLTRVRPVECLHAVAARLRIYPVDVDLAVLPNDSLLVVFK